MKKLDMAGQRFGALLGLSFYRSVDQSAVWLFACDCGTFLHRVAKSVQHAVKKGTAPNCGCLTSKIRAGNGHLNKTHGFSKTKLYDVHFQMMRRCYNDQCKDYPAYGARGIEVCDEWFDIEVFVGWCIISGYREGLTIERQDVNGNYAPENCTWIVNERQARNRRHHVVLTANGVSRPVWEWAELTGIARNTLVTRLRLGWAEQDIVSVPVGARRPA